MKLATVRPIKKVTIIKRLISHIKYLYCEQSLRRHNFNVLLENEELNLSMIISNRGVSDVGFPIFADADTDADFAF